MKLFRNKTKGQGHSDNLDASLYRIPGTEVDILKADSCLGTVIFGAPGSGKTSAVGRHIAMAMLKANYGMVVHCAKPDERQTWEKEYIPEAGRESDLVIFDKASPYSFNFLEYEMKRQGLGRGDVNVVVNTFMAIHQLINNTQAGGGAVEQERFWDQSLRRLIGRTLNLLQIAQIEINVDNMRKVISNTFERGELERYREIQEGLVNDKLDGRVLAEMETEFSEWKRDNYFLWAFEKRHW